MREIITLLEANSKPKEVEIIKLNYKNTELAPVMSAATMNYHYGKLAHTYADRYNKKEGDPTFNYAGAVLHNIFFPQFRRARQNNKPNGPIGSFIKSKFGSWDDFKAEFEKTAMALQGSGWVYLSRNGTIKVIHNHALRDDILILLDMWEHSFNLQYGADKKKYINETWKIFDWNVINARWGQAYK
jgi:Fe-Mn family superoxide dismutase